MEPIYLDYAATAAIQTVFGHDEERRRQAGTPLPSPQGR